MQDPSELHVPTGMNPQKTRHGPVQSESDAQSAMAAATMHTPLLVDEVLLVVLVLLVDEVVLVLLVDDVVLVVDDVVLVVDVVLLLLVDVAGAAPAPPPLSPAPVPVGAPPLAEAVVVEAPPLPVGPAEGPLPATSPPLPSPSTPVPCAQLTDTITPNAKQASKLTVLTARPMLSGFGKLAYGETRRRYVDTAPRRR